MYFLKKKHIKTKLLSISFIGSQLLWDLARSEHGVWRWQWKYSVEIDFSPNSNKFLDDRKGVCCSFGDTYLQSKFLCCVFQLNVKLVLKCPNIRSFKWITIKFKENFYKKCQKFLFSSSIFVFRLPVCC